MVKHVLNMQKICKKIIQFGRVKLHQSLDATWFWTLSCALHTPTFIIFSYFFLSPLNLYVYFWISVNNLKWKAVKELISADLSFFCMLAWGGQAMEGAKEVWCLNKWSRDSTQTKMGGLIKTKMRGLIQTKMGDLKQAKMWDLKQARMGHSTQAKMGDLKQAKMGDMTVVWLFPMVIHLGPEGAMVLAMALQGVLLCQMGSPTKRHQPCELRFLFLISSNRVYLAMK